MKLEPFNEKNLNLLLFHLQRKVLLSKLCAKKWHSDLKVEFLLKYSKNHKYMKYQSNSGKRTLMWWIPVKFYRYSLMESCPRHFTMMIFGVCLCACVGVYVILLQKTLPNFLPFVCCFFLPLLSIIHGYVLQCVM